MIMPAYFAISVLRDRETLTSVTGVFSYDKLWVGMGTVDCKLCPDLMEIDEGGFHKAFLDES